MRYEEFADFIDKEVLLTTSKGNSFRGVLTLGETAFDSSSGEDEVDVFSEFGCAEIPFSSIKSVSII